MTALSAKLLAAHAAMQCAMSEWAEGAEITIPDLDRLEMIRAYCDLLLTGERPALRLEGAGEAYRRAHANT